MSLLEAAPIARAIPLVDIAGAPYERGVQFGRACGDLVARYPEVLRRAFSQESRLRDPSAEPRELTARELESRTMRFLPLFERYGPDLVQEIRGVADGADVPFWQALLVNVRSEIGVFDRAGAGEGGCTAFAIHRDATADGGVLLGQNQDQMAGMEDFVVAVRVEPDRGPRMIMASFGGLLGYPGFNSAGVGFLQNSLTNSVWRFALPHYPMKRRLLEQDSIAGCLKVMGGSEVGSCGNYVLVDRESAVDVEMTPDGYATLPSDSGVVAHANHFRDPQLSIDERRPSSLADSQSRNARISALLEARGGSLTAADLTVACADHDGSPTGICRHAFGPDGVKTIYSVICEVDKGLMHLCLGNPCRAEYQTFSLH